MTTCRPTIHEDKMLALKLTRTSTLVVLLVPKLERFHVPADRSQDVRLCLKRCELILCRGYSGVSTLGQLQQVRKLTIQQFCNLNSHILPSFGCVVWRRPQQVPAGPSSTEAPRILQLPEIKTFIRKFQSSLQVRFVGSGSSSNIRYTHILLNVGNEGRGLSC